MILFFGSAKWTIANIPSVHKYEKKDTPQCHKFQNAKPQFYSDQ